MLYCESLFQDQIFMHVKNITTSRKKKINFVLTDNNDRIYSFIKKKKAFFGLNTFIST